MYALSQVGVRNIGLRSQTRLTVDRCVDSLWMSISGGDGDRTLRQTAVPSGPELCVLAPACPFRDVFLDFERKAFSSGVRVCVRTSDAITQRLIVSPWSMELLCD